MSDIDKILEDVERRETPYDRDLADEQTAMLAAEVRRLRAKLVEAAKDIAMRFEDDGGSDAESIAYAEEVTGIRLRLEGTDLVESK